MPIPAAVGAFAIVPCNDLLGAVLFWERLGFVRTGGDANYIILTGWECEVHLTQAGTGPWSVPTEHNPVGVFIRTPEVESIAARVDDLIIRPRRGNTPMFKRTRMWRDRSRLMLHLSRSGSGTHPNSGAQQIQRHHHRCGPERDRRAGSRSAGWASEKSRELDQRVSTALR